MAWEFKGRSSVYSQIIDILRGDILSGKYKPGEQLPSVRQLSIEAGVNPNTMQRAMTQLESEHLFVTKGTLGRFVTDDTSIIEKTAKERRDAAFEEVIAFAQGLGISTSELLEYISVLNSNNEKCEAKNYRNESEDK